MLLASGSRMTRSAAFDLGPTVVVTVTGHRTLPSPAAVRDRLDELFALIKAAKVAGGADLRIVSPLAEGADRLFCEAGLASGASLHCPLPFHRDEYLKDFKQPASREHFSALLAKADRVLELDGDPQRRDAAYAVVGRLMAARGDLLVAVWDGKPSRGKGGTAEVVAEALGLGVLVAHIDPSGKAPTAILEGEMHRHRRQPIEGLGERLDRLLIGPEGEDERGPARLRALLEGRQAAQAGLEASRAHWIGLLPAHEALGAVCAPCTQGDVIAAFAWADSLANRYAALYRLAYWLNFIFGAIAVAMALVGARFPSPAFPLVELLAIGVIVASTVTANARHWHERWIECRHLAEQLRPVRFLFPLGLGLPRLHDTRLAHQGEGISAWDDWLVHRIDIGLGFPGVTITPDHVEAVRQFVLADVIPDQIRYHARKAERMRGADGSMHALGIVMFFITAAVCIAEVVNFLVFGHRQGAESPMEVVLPALLVISGLAPAVGAGLLGVRNVGEYERLEKRSKAMAEALERAQRSLEDKTLDHLHYERLSRRLEDLAALMMSETADWRTLVITRRIELVG